MSSFLQQFAQQFAELDKDNLRRLDDLYTPDVRFTPPSQGKYFSTLLLSE